MSADLDAIRAALAASGLLVESTEVDRAKTGIAVIHRTAAASVPVVATLFREHGYVLELLTCQDRRADLQKMRLVYGFNRWDVADRHLLHADLDPGEAAPTLAGLYRSADWNEREVWDMYGVRFDGHPNLARILLPEDADFHALLKDFGRMEDAQP